MTLNSEALKIRASATVCSNSDFSVCKLLIVSFRSTTASLTMFENAITTVGSISTVSTTICSGETPLIITGDAGVVGGSLSYQWESSLDGLSWNPINTATGVLRDFTPDTPLTQTTIFRRC